MSKTQDKFEFDTDFQLNLLKYTLLDRNGYKALSLYEDYYFTLLEHQIIARVIKNFFKKKNHLPQDKVILREQLRQLYLTKDFISSVTTNDKKLVGNALNKIYKGNVKGGDSILEEAIKFRQYINLRNTLEKVDLQNYSQYEDFSNSVRKAITIGKEHTKEAGTFLFKDFKDRQFKRSMNDTIHPTPFWQLNQLTNSGGYSKGSVVVILGPEKRFKTGLLVNFGKGYLKMRKKILVIDLENGQDSYALRFEQCIMGKTKGDILRGDLDAQVAKQFRKYVRIGAELHIKRLPAYTTTMATVQNYIDELYREYGIKFNGIICDYVALAGAISGKKDDNERISDAYIDFKNLVEYNDYEIGLTAHHLTREGKKRIATKFISNDTAKCIDISRHVDAMIGFNQNDDEFNKGIARLEIIEQRDGVPDGRAFFKVDIKTQRASELSKVEIDNYKKFIELAKTTEKKPSNDL